MLTCCVCDVFVPLRVRKVIVLYRVSSHMNYGEFQNQKQVGQYFCSTVKSTKLCTTPVQILLKILPKHGARVTVHNAAR